MSREEFFEHLYAMNREGQDREIVAFAKAHAPEMASRLSGDEQMRLHGLVEGALMALDLEESFVEPIESRVTEFNARSLADHD